MYLIQILLPLCSTAGRAFPSSLYKCVKSTLAEHYEGFTSRAATEGLWCRGMKVKRDDVIVYEVMVPSFERKWWKNYRTSLEKMFFQKSISIRLQKIILP